MRPMRRATVGTALAMVAALFITATAGAWTAPPVGTAPGAVDLRSVPGVVPHGDGFAVPMRGATPSWYTAELAAEVLARPGRPVAAPIDAPFPSVVGIRPGAWMISPAGCTMNFVFSKGGSVAIGTAGHCVDKVGQPVVLLTVAPGGSNPVLVNVGSVLARRDGGVGDDFALVSIAPALRTWVSATTALVGGPCGAYSGSGPETVWHYGHGLAIGTGGTPRAGVSLNWKAGAYGWDGLAIFGDSGSPVRVTALPAAGNLTHLVVDTRWLPSFIVGTRIGKMLKIAKGWSLLSSPLCP
ncbi:MAG: hypothetical protein HY658_09830 [Actinobacteria bacterium]|nr:hypothetical protein [Actinomycetota bacterium]